MAISPQRKSVRMRVDRLRKGRFSTRMDQIAVEEPLEVRVEVPGRPSGDDRSGGQGGVRADGLGGAGGDLGGRGSRGGANLGDAGAAASGGLSSGQAGGPDVAGATYDSPMGQVSSPGNSDAPATGATGGTESGGPSESADASTTSGVESTDAAGSPGDAATATTGTTAIADLDPAQLGPKVATTTPTEHPVSVTMRTPGDDFELAAGFLYTEGIVRNPAALTDVRYCRNVEPQEYNVVTVALRDASAFDPETLTRNFYVTSSCGVCGKASLDAVEVIGCQPVSDSRFAITEEVVKSLPNKLRAAQRVFDRTGGLHAAGLFDANGELLTVREDVGRHNAVDKVVGKLVLEGTIPAPDLGLVVSGRTSFEILQKAAMAGFPVVVAVGAPSSLAVQFARRFQMTLAGFTGESGYNVYAGGERITAGNTPHPQPTATSP